MMVLWEHDKQPVNDIARRLMLEEAMEQLAYELIPAGMAEELRSCPLSVDEYTALTHKLDQIIDTLKKN